MKTRKGFMKSYVRSLLVGVLTIATILPNFSITANAQVNPTSYTVTSTTSATATFKHQHKTSGTAVNNAKIQSNSTVSGYSQQSACYHTLKKHSHEGNTTSGGNCYDTHTTTIYKVHKHTDSCKKWVQKYEFRPYDINRKSTYSRGNYNCVCGWYVTNAAYHHTDNHYSYAHNDSATMSDSEWTGYDPTHITGVATYLWWDLENSRWASDSTCGNCWNPTNVSGAANRNAPWTGKVVNNMYCYWNGSYVCGKTEGQRYADEGIDHYEYTYTLKNPDPYYTGNVYVNDCGITSGATIGTAKVTANANNQLTCTVTNSIGNKGSYTITLKKPDNSTQALTSGTAYQCTTIGTYTITVNFKSTIQSTVVDNDTVTFTYVAEPKNTTINFRDYNGNILSSTTVKQGNEPSTVTKPTRVGYTFSGYYLDNGNTQYYDANGSKKVNNYCPLNGGTVNLYAKYNPNTYTVKYYTVDTTKETGTQKSVTQTYDATPVNLQSAKTYSGYTFLGWYDSTGTTQYFDASGKYTGGTKWNLTTNLTVYEKYRANQFDLYYNNNKEEAVEINKVTITYDSAYDLPDKTHTDYTGYTFKGWIDANLGQIFKVDGSNSDTGIWKYVSDVKAKATYEANSYTVSYYLENPIEETKVDKSKTFVYDSANPTIEAQKVYDGWTSDGFYNGTEKVFNADGTFVGGTKWNIDSNLTLVPKFTAKTYTLHYNLNKEENVTSHTQMIQFNNDYALFPTDISNRKAYKGYTFNGWYDGSTLIFNPDGTNTDTGKWRYLTDINAVATYTANPYKVYYNTSESGSTTNVLDVTFDSAYALPSASVNAVPHKDGYTFDGWFLASDPTVKVFNTNGSSVKPLYDYDTDITVVVKYHKNKYVIHFNNDDIDDTNLNEQQEVTFDLSYLDISQAPYKTGYIFDGHFIEGTTTFIWDGKGDVTHAIWDFVLGNDGTEVNALKNYSPKVFNVDIGSDFDNDGVIDSIEDTKTATYDSPYFALDVPTYINGYTFDGWYILELGKWIATYDPSTDILTKVDTNWVYDDGVNWVNDPHSNLTLVRKWHQNTYTVKYNDTTVADTTKTNVNLVFDNAYAPINVQPHKYGYTGIGWYFVDKNGVEQKIWNEDGTSTKATFTYDLDVDNTVVEVYKKYTPNPYTVTYNTDEKDTPSIVLNVVFDSPYELPTADVNSVPYKEGYTFDGWFLSDGTQIFDVDGKPVISNTYEYEGNRTVYVRYHQNTYYVRYNNVDLDDNTLDKYQKVVFDNPYTEIEVSPYKEGYMFDGHFIDGTTMMIWDKFGQPTVNPYNFATMNSDNDTITTHKVYHAKTVTVNVGIDYDEDKVIDKASKLPSGQAYNSQFTMLYNDIVPDTEFPNLKETGLTLDGWYVICNGQELGCLYKYDKNTDTLVKQTNTWVFDDGKDWNIESPSEFMVVARFIHDPVTVTVKTETDRKITKDVGKKSDYEFDTKTRTEHFDIAYDNEVKPTKRGYTFNGYIVNPKNDNESKDIWDADAKSIENTFRWLPTTGKTEVEVISTFTANQIKGQIPTEKYDPTTDETTPNPTPIDNKYDDPYPKLPEIPEKKGYDFDGIDDKDGNPIWDKDGEPEQEVWEYVPEDIDEFVIKWKPKTYILVYPDKTEVTVTYDAPVDTNKTDSSTGHTFKGWTFEHNKKTIHAFDSNGKYNGTVWTYDFGKTGTKIPLKAVFDVNTYQITIKPMVQGLDPYTIEVAYGSGYPEVQIPIKKGYVFDGYDLEFDNNHTDELSEPLWDKDGKPVKDTFGYTHNISVLAKYVPKFYYLHLDDTIIKVTFDDKVKDGITLSKDGTEDDDYTYSYDFNGWFLKNGTQIFNADGTPIYKVWTLDLGANGSHIYLDGQFNENKVEKDKPIPEEPEPEIEEPTPDPDPTPEEVVVEDDDIKGNRPFFNADTLKKIAITTGIGIGAILLLIGLLLLILLLLFLLGEISLVYRFDYNKGKKKLDGIIKIHKFKKGEMNDDGTNYYVRLNEKYYNALLDTNSKLISVKLAPHWCDRHHNKFVRIQCKNIYDDFKLASVKHNKGDIDRGYIECQLTRTFN